MKPLSLSKILMIFLAVTSLVPIIVIAIYANFTLTQLFKAQTLENLSHIADLKASAIEKYYTRKRKNILTYSKSPALNQVIKQISKEYYQNGVNSESYLTSNQLVREYFYELSDVERLYDIFLISKQGDVVFSILNEANFNTNLMTGKFSNSALGRSVQTALKNITINTSLFQYNELSQTNAGFISVPVIQNSEILGAIAIQLNLDDIYEILLNNIGMGNSGETISVRLHSEKPQLTVPLKDDSSSAFFKIIENGQFSEILKQALDGDNDQEIVKDFRGNLVVASWRYLPSLQWGMVVKTDLSEALKPIKEIRMVLFYVLLFLLSVVIISSFILGNKILQPIRDLISSITETIRTKVLNEVTPLGYTEVRKLAISFNGMSSKLNHYQKNLEDIVLQRTQQLQRASHIIKATQQAIVVTDKNSIIIEVNKAYCDLFEYSEKELIGQNQNIISSHKHDKDFFTKMWTQINAEGYWSGEVWNRKKSGEIIPILLNISSIEESSNHSLNYVGILTNIELFKNQEKLLHQLAYFDPLTNLPNRLLMQDRLKRDIKYARRNNNMLAVLFLDLDRFKNVNDTLGHSAGDILLQIIAKRLIENTRSSDSIARLGGDEFVIIINELHSTSVVASIATNIIKSVSQAVNINDNVVFVGASIGISVFPQDGNNSETLLKNADIAMYQAKDNGKGAYHFFTSDPDKTDSFPALKIEAELRKAVSNNELILYFQPQLDIKTTQLTGAEALIRWIHPERGFITPDSFITIAEATGLISDIDQWVINQACLQLKDWKRKGLPEIRIAINLSSDHFSNPELIKDIQKFLSSNEIDPSLLEFEITERIIMRSPDKAAIVMNDLNGIGIKISIDDFGTGYSSLSYLKQFPASTLKIDKAFVNGLPDDENDAAIAQTIINLGSSLNMSVLAEGVETESQRQFLIENNCNEVQGYLFSEPLPAKEFAEKWLKNK